MWIFWTIFGSSLLAAGVMGHLNWVETNRISENANKLIEKINKT